MKHIVPATLLTVFACASASADVVTSATCSIGTQSVSNPANCSLNSSSAYPSANASITVNQLTSIPAQGSLTSVTADVTGSVLARPLSNIGTGPNVPATATASANIAYQLFTPGPMRQGIMTYTGFTVNFVYGPGNDSAKAAISVGSLSESCMGNGFNCYDFFNSLTPRSASFTLGNPFAFSFSESFSAYGDPYVEGPGNASGRVVFNFQLFEADGKTPVAIYAAPEPGTFGLLLTCLGGLGAMYYGVRRRSFHHS